MRYFFILSLCACFHQGVAQELQNVNYTYQYNPASPFDFDWEIIREQEGWKIRYSLVVADTNQYAILWETRNSIREESGRILKTPTHKKEGELFFPKDSLQQFIIAKIVNLNQKQAWYYYDYLNPKHPHNFSIHVSDSSIGKAYLPAHSTILLEGDSGSIASAFFYQQDFPPAAPPFSESLSRVSAGMKSDSSFVIKANQKTELIKPGLYLFQKDTASTDGIAFRVEDDYPKYKTIQNLIGPIQYICTKQEYDKLLAANGDKKTFDKIILGITGNKDRAKDFMRSYFTNVELANRYFTSYKEGWKTDRGMIFIVLGLPSTVYKFSDREVWDYKTPVYDLSFTFERSPTVFDPENYVLIRDKKYQLDWYEIVDLWRKARF